MMMALEVSAQLGLCPSADVERTRAHFADAGLPVAVGGNRNWDAATLIGHMSHDKKVRDGRVTFILARGIGDAFVARDVDLAEVERVLRRTLAA